jgi:hypothetical protein
MSRLVAAGAVVHDQLDFFSPPTSINRLTGVVVANLTFTQFVNSSLLAWPLADGSSVADSSISSGTAYFHEIPGSPGFYSVRFLPDRIGFWRLVFRNASIGIEIRKEFDVVAAGSLKPASSSGLVASFVQ